MSIVAAGQQPLLKGIALETREGTPISNYQDDKYPDNAASIDAHFRGEHPNIVAERSDLSGYYNCHGLVFAARRTWLYRLEEISAILDEDCYVEIDSVMPGDVILYYDRDGDIEHSGIVVSKPEAVSLQVPMVVSKWGAWREVLHWANDSPYEYAQIRFYRVTR